MKYCHNCGQKLEDNDIFCDNCGAKLVEDSSPANIISNNANDNSQQKSSTMSELMRMGKMFTGIFVVSLVIVVFVIFNTSSVMKNEGSRNNSPSTSTSNTSQNSTQPPSNSSSSSRNNTPPPSNTSSSSQNNSSTYNYTFNDNSTGIVYEAVSKSGFSFGIIEITRQKEIYCDFKKSPRASGMFHIVKFAVGNGRNEQILRGQYYLIDDRGRQFGSDINASSTYQTMIGLNPPYEINPGQAVIDFDVFDIPDNVNIVKARYEPFLYDGGIEVPYRVSTK